MRFGALASLFGAFGLLVLSLLFLAAPFARNWDKTVAGHCVDLVAFFRWNGICNLILDFCILLLPLPMVWRLNISVRQRLELSGVFLLGVL